MKTLSASLLLGSATLTSAATITIVQTLDLTLTNQTPTSFNLNTNSIAGGPFNVVNGDTIDFTLDFLGNQSLKMTNPTFFYGVVFNPNNIGNHNGSGTVNFLNATGPINSSFTANFVSCCNHLGPLLTPADFVTGPGTIEFTGIHTVLTVSGFGGTNISGIAFGAFASSVEIGTFSGDEGPVDAPEPAALVLLGGGLLGLAGLRRRRAA